MYKSNGETTTDREKILSICADFYRKLYKKVIPGHDIIIESSTEELDPFTTEEVDNIIKKMKNDKAPGNDHLTKDIIQLGGPDAIENLTEAFNNILTTQRIPET